MPELAFLKVIVFKFSAFGEQINYQDGGKEIQKNLVNEGLIFGKKLEKSVHGICYESKGINIVPLIPRASGLKIDLMALSHADFIFNP